MRLTPETPSEYLPLPQPGMAWGRAKLTLYVQVPIGSDSRETEHAFVRALNGAHWPAASEPDGAYACWEFAEPNRRWQPKAKPFAGIPLAERRPPSNYAPTPGIEVGIR